jgi:hypothetical protein
MSRDTAKRNPLQVGNDFQGDVLQLCTLGNLTANTTHFHHSSPKLINFNSLYILLIKTAGSLSMAMQPDNWTCTREGVSCLPLPPGVTGRK